AALAIAGIGGRFVPTALILYTVALLANLKRGAWLGTFAALATIGLVRSRRLILAALAVIVGAVLFVGPVRDRIEATTRDFFLPGSRYDIWSAAVDVIERFPMGVGRKNGTILRDYPNIPQRHRHAHNNVLQVTMENGFLGLATFLWWMGRFGALTYGVWRRLAPEQRIARAISVAVFADFIGFHVAGLVEFNFGDTEVVQVLFVTMGLGLRTAEIAGLTARTEPSTNS
ncbi:MAG: O-antigen ligase family protein, partial [Candidatus Binatia bacterium]